MPVSTMKEGKKTFITIQGGNVVPFLYRNKNIYGEKIGVMYNMFFCFSAFIICGFTPLS